MTDLKTHVLNEIHRQRGLPLHRGKIGGVALHPETWMELQVGSDWPLHAQNAPLRTINGFEVLKTMNVPKGELHIVPKGTLEVARDREGQPYLWPAFSIVLFDREFQMGTYVNKYGQLVGRSEYLDPPFDHRNSEKIAHYHD